MKKEYDFSKGERGKFYQENIKLNTPDDSPKKKKGSLIEILQKSPLHDSGIDLERDKDYGREIDL